MCNYPFGSLSVGQVTLCLIQLIDWILINAGKLIKMNTDCTPDEWEEDVNVIKGEHPDILSNFKVHMHKRVRLVLKLDLVQAKFTFVRNW